MLLAKTLGQLFFDITKARGMLVVQPDLSTVSSARCFDRATRMTGRQCSALFVLDHNVGTQHKSHAWALFHNTTMIVQSRFAITGRLQRLG